MVTRCADIAMVTELRNVWTHGDSESSGDMGLFLRCSSPSVSVSWGTHKAKVTWDWLHGAVVYESGCSYGHSVSCGDMGFWW